MLKKAETSKKDRAVLFFVRTFMILSFVAFFGAGAFAMRRLEENTEEGGEDADKPAAESESKFNPYMLILPYFTFVPIMVILGSMISGK